MEEKNKSKDIKKLFILIISIILILSGIYSVVEGFKVSDLGSGAAIAFGMLVLIIGLVLFPKRRKKSKNYKLPNHFKDKE